jgi:osmoprotectant transport system permease protein
VTGMLAVGELFRWDWVIDHKDVVAQRTLEHMQLTFLAVGIGVAISWPIAIFAHRLRAAYGPITWVTGFLYTIPSLALFVLLVPITGLSTTTAEIGLVSYTLLILIRNVVAGLDGVAGDAKEAALGMGFTNRQMLWRVEFPLALPVIIAGIRIATVTTIGLVTVTALIGKGGFGYFILLGDNRGFPTATILGAVLSVAFAVAADGFLLGIQRVLAPWRRASRLRTFG